MSNQVSSPVSNSMKYARMNDSYTQILVSKFAKIALLSMLSGLPFGLLILPFVGAFTLSFNMPVATGNVAEFVSQLIVSILNAGTIAGIFGYALWISFYYVALPLMFMAVGGFFMVKHEMDITAKIIVAYIQFRQENKNNKA